MILEPFFVLTPLGTMFSYQFPESLCVIHLFQMGKLMDDDVVNDRLRGHYKLPVKAKVAFIGAATPTGLLPSYENSVIGEPQASTQFVRPLLYQFRSLHSIPLLQYQIQSTAR